MGFMCKRWRTLKTCLSTHFFWLKIHCEERDRERNKEHSAFPVRITQGLWELPMQFTWRGKHLMKYTTSHPKPLNFSKLASCLPSEKQTWGVKNTSTSNVLQANLVGRRFQRPSSPPEHIPFLSKYAAYTCGTNPLLQLCFRETCNTLVLSKDLYADLSQHKTINYTIADIHNCIWLQQTSFENQEFFFDNWFQMF